MLCSVDHVTLTKNERIFDGSPKRAQAVHEASSRRTLDGTNAANVTVSFGISSIG